MSDKTRIGWTYVQVGEKFYQGATWPVIVGCKRVSPGCDNCYAIRDGWRMGANPNEKIKAVYGGLVAKDEETEALDWTGVVRCLPERLDWPEKWQKPRGIFVCSESDYLHDDVPGEFILRIWEVMLKNPQHIYQLLTKRIPRLVNLVPVLTELPDYITGSRIWPEHIWIGVSVEDAARAGRLYHLRKIPAAVRFVSWEPALGPIAHVPLYGIDWLIAGAESGNRAKIRPMDEQWVQHIHEACQTLDIAFFYKQSLDPVTGEKNTSPKLEGREWKEYPIPKRREPQHA